MKFTFITDAVDKILRISEKEKNADMRLPTKVSAFGVAMTFCGLFLVIISIISSAFAMLFFALLSFLIAAFAFLCYKFQRIYILSETEFEYTTFWGKKKIYKFEHIRAIKTNTDSHVLIFTKGRINIETSAILSEKLKILFNKELKRIHQENIERKARLKAAKEKKLKELQRSSSVAKSPNTAEKQTAAENPQKTQNPENTGENNENNK